MSPLCLIEAPLGPHWGSVRFALLKQADCTSFDGLRYKYEPKGALCVCWAPTVSLPVHVLREARTRPVTFEAVAALGTQAHLAHLPRVAGLTHTHAADVVALGAVHTAARLGTVHTK